ncbi:MAG: metallophosphoesterase [Cytophagales bacterium]|nr:metallophosphoesterase [Cytophagales bacterium]
MAVAIVHLSDFHNVIGRSEGHAVVVDELFADLKNQLELIAAESVFVAFSGDIAQAGDSEPQYTDFLNVFDKKLIELGIPKTHRICVPGNHDLSRNLVKDKLVVHEGVVSQNLAEKEFNDFVLNAPNVLTEKFSNYLAFQEKFCSFGVGALAPSGAGWDLTKDVGVYCLNTALCSSGGLFKGEIEIPDKRRLGIDTRTLHNWLQNSKAKWKILVMHHPLHWLTESAQRELKVLLNKHFSVRLYGHEHEQESLHSISAGKSLIECCSPALYSSKHDLLGYSIMVIDESSGPRELVYRQWTKNQSFVSGVSFSNTDNGRVLFQDYSVSHKSTTNSSDNDPVLKYFSKRLDAALVSFSGQPRVWVEPVLKTKPEVERDEQSIAPVNLMSLIEAPISSLVHALPQFGLTCLSYYLVKTAWEQRGDLWLYFDASELKPGTVKETTARELSEVGLAHSQVRCLVIDTVSPSGKDVWKIVRKLSEHFPSVPIICMYTVDPATLHSDQKTHPEIGVTFQSLYLWTLSRDLIRGIVTEYNDQLEIGDDNDVMTKIVADLEMLNLHRTPLNCLTLLKVSEVDFDSSPVNRSEMIKRILFLLFNAQSIPSYKARPDLKDCEYVLGHFCASLLEKGVFTFSRDYFIASLQKCCRDGYIDLEVQVVFDILSANNILVPRDGKFAFKFSFWIYYFAALRMHHEPSFATYMLSDFKYAGMPEVVEFYTGIDRQREDAVKSLTKDLETIRLQIDEKCGFPKNMDPYRLAQWQPTEEALAKMTDEIEVGIQDSNLPSEIKDHFADRDYDPKRPYDQSISVLAEQTITCLMQTLRAASKALRNSDYVAPIYKRALLEEILQCWEQLTMVLLVVMPVLAEKGQALFDGVNFVLDGNFGSTPKERVIGILMEIPVNVVGWSRDDLHSQKMGPLFLDVFSKEPIELRKHELALLLIAQKPRGWHDAIQAYIASIHKNSFYLLSVYRALRTQYRYSYVSNTTLKEIAHLIQMSITKHLTGAKDPGVKLIAKTMPQLKGDPAIPPREVS